MKYKYLLFSLMFLLIFTPAVSAFEWCEWIPFWECTDDITNNTISHSPKWLLDYTDGIQEEYFDTTIENMENGKAKICLIPKVELKINDQIIQDSRAILKLNNIQTRIVEPSDMELESELGNIKKMCVDVDILTEDYIKFGQDSTVVTYVEDNLEITNSSNFILQDITLEENSDQCLINCYSKGHTVIYTDSQLFEDFDFKDSNNNTINITGSNLFIEQITETLKNVTDYGQDCSEHDFGNGTILETCEQTITGYHNVTVITKDYVPYDFSVLPSGTYNWMINANKNKDFNIDWSVSLQGFNSNVIRQYWAWWNTSWVYKEEIGNLSGEYPTFNISYDGDMNTDFSDLRFLTTDGLTELNYTLRSKNDSSWAYVTVDTNNVSAIDMYFGNALATSTSSVNDTFLSPLSIWTLDTGFTDYSSGITLSGVNTPTNTIAYIDRGYDLDIGSLEYLKRLNYNTLSGTASFTLNMRIKAASNVGDDYFFQLGDGANPSRGFRVDDTDSKIAYRTQGGTTESINVFSLNQWYHITLVYSGSQARVYENANQVIQAPDTYSLTAPDLWIGWFDTSYLFDGLVDEIYIHTRVLSNETIDEFNSMQTRIATFGTKTPLNSAPVFSNVALFALDSDQAVLGSVSYFNTANISNIEYLLINFTVVDESNFSTVSNMSIYYSANGTNGCALGNLQNILCYNNLDFIHYQRGGTTSTFKDEGTLGDFIDCSYIEINTTYREYSCIIDEHYNPNVFKWYSAGYNFSDVKYQSGLNQRITKNNLLKIYLNTSLVPNNSDIYKLDFRVNASEAGTSLLSAYFCNSSYSVGNPATSNQCQLVSTKDATELQSGGTKFRATFTQYLIQNLGDIQYVVLKSNSLNPNVYYKLKTIGATTGGWTTKWNYSTNNGATYANLGDGYESELNINWFSSGATPTKLNFKIYMNDSLGVDANSSIYNLTWTIDANQSYPPIINILYPKSGQNITDTQNITINWSISDPNEDNFKINVTATNGTDIDISLAIDMSVTEIFWDSSNKFGDWNITVTAYENDSTDLLYHNETVGINLGIIPTTTLTFTPSSPITFPTQVNVSCVSDSDGILTLYQNGTNVTSNNNVLVTLGVGSYNYTCITDYSTDYQSSTTQDTLIVNKGVLTGSLTNTESWTESYPTEVTIGLSESNAGDGDVTYEIFRDGINKSTGETVTLGAGTYLYVLNSTGGANYTANTSIDNQTLTINQNSGSCDVLFNATSPLAQTYTFLVWTNCNSTFTLYRNGTIIANNSVQDLAAGSYNYTVTRNDTSNYSNTYDEELFTLTSLPTPSTNLTIFPATPVTYPQLHNVSCVSDSDGDLTLYRNGTNITDQNHQIFDLGFGTYNYTCITDATMSYLTTVKQETYVMNQNTSSCNIYFSRDSPQTYPVIFLAYTDCSTSYNFYRNGTSIVNTSLQELPVGTYNFTVIRLDQFNYSNITDTEIFVITESTPEPATPFTEPLNMRRWLLDIVSGNELIFTAIALLFIFALAGFFRMNLLVTGFMVAVFLLLFSTVVDQSIYFIIASVGVLIISPILNKLIKR